MSDVFQQRVQKLMEENDGPSVDHILKVHNKPLRNLLLMYGIMVCVLDERDHDRESPNVQQIMRVTSMSRRNAHEYLAALCILAAMNERGKLNSITTTDNEVLQDSTSVQQDSTTTTRDLGHEHDTF